MEKQIVEVEEIQKLMELGLTFEHAKIAVGRIVEHLQIADMAGYNRGFDAGYNEGYDEGHSKECFFTG